MRPRPGTAPGTPSSIRSAAYVASAPGAPQPPCAPYTCDVIQTLMHHRLSYHSADIHVKRRYIHEVFSNDGHWWAAAWSRRARLDKFQSWQRRRAFEDTWCMDLLKDSEKRARPFIPRGYTGRFWFCMGSAARWMPPTLGGFAATPKRGLMVALRRAIATRNAQSGRFADGRPHRVWAARYADERFTSKISWCSGQRMQRIWTERKPLPGKKPFNSGRARVKETLCIHDPSKDGDAPPQPSEDQQTLQQSMLDLQEKRQFKQRVAGQGQHALNADHLRLLDFLASEQQTEPRQTAPGHTFLRGLLYCPGLRMFLDRDKAAAIAIAGTAMYELAAASERPDLCRDKALRKHLRPDVYQPTKASGPDESSGGFHRAPPLVPPVQPPAGGSA